MISILAYFEKVFKNGRNIRPKKKNADIVSTIWDSYSLQTK